MHHENAPSEEPQELESPQARNKSNGSFLSEHSSALVVGSIALIGSVFYFSGSQYVDTLARTYGFAGDIGQSDLQKTMADGANVIFTGRFLPFLGGVLTIAWTLIAALDFITDPYRARAKLKRYKVTLRKVVNERETIGQAAENKKMTWFEEGLLGVVLLAGRFHIHRVSIGVSLLEILVDMRSVRSLLGAILLSLAAITSFWLVLTAGKLEAEREANAIAMDLRSECKRCRLFTIGGKSVVGIAVRQTPDGMIVAERSGASFIPTQDGVRISAPPLKTKQGIRPAKAYADDSGQAPAPAPHAPLSAS
jgi:hypothetical protein